jgi:hypothetical protein
MRILACALASAALCLLPACSFQPSRATEESSDVYVASEVLSNDDRLIRRYLRALKADYAALQEEEEEDASLLLHIINSQALARLDTAQRREALRDLSLLALKVTRAEYEHIRISLSHKDSLAQWGYVACDYSLTDFPGEFGEDGFRDSEEEDLQGLPDLSIDMLDSSQSLGDTLELEEAEQDP